MRSDRSMAHAERDRIKAKIATCTDPIALALLQTDLNRLLNYPQLHIEDETTVRRTPRDESRFTKTS